MREMIFLNIKDCARCGGCHTLIFRKFKGTPPPSYTHWGMCSVANEPILMEVELTESTDADATTQLA